MGETINLDKELISIDKAVEVSRDIIKETCPNLIQNGDELKEMEQILRNKMKNFRTDKEILSVVNHPRNGFVDINKAREWVKNAFIGPFGEGLANSIADEFVKAMEE
jgi:hypothetical protein